MGKKLKPAKSMSLDEMEDQAGMIQIRSMLEILATVEGVYESGKPISKKTWEKISELGGEFFEAGVIEHEIAATPR